MRDEVGDVDTVKKMRNYSLPRGVVHRNLPRRVGLSIQFLFGAGNQSLQSAHMGCMGKGNLDGIYTRYLATGRHRRQSHVPPDSIRFIDSQLELVSLRMGDDDRVDTVNRNGIFRGSGR